MTAGQTAVVSRACSPLLRTIAPRRDRRKHPQDSGRPRENDESNGQINDDDNGTELDN